MAKGDITHIQKKFCRYLLSYSPGGSTCREIGPVQCNWDAILGEENVGVTMVAFESDGGFL